MNVLILMAGNSNDFEKNGYNYPKYFLEIQNKPIIQRIIETLSKITDNIFCIIKKEDQEKYYLKDALKILHPNAQVIELPKETKGALCSALFAIDKINNDDELLICNGDQFIKSDISKAIVDFKKRNLDAGIIVFKALNPKFSTVLLDENNLVIQAEEKQPISNLASSGCCYYKKGSDFIEASFKVIEKDIKTQGRYFVSSTFNEMILKDKKIGIFEIPKKDYISFCEFQMYENYLSHRRQKYD